MKALEGENPGSDDAHWNDPILKEAYEKAVAELDEKRIRRRTADAIARGFSSWSKMEEHDAKVVLEREEAAAKAWEQRTKPYGRNMEEFQERRKTDRELAAKLAAQADRLHCSSWEEVERCESRRYRNIGKDFYKEMEKMAVSWDLPVEEIFRDFSQYRDIPWEEANFWDDCDCDEHPIPFFCPRSLADHRSQDAPTLMENIAYEHRLKPEKVNIKPGEKSRRLSSGPLEQAWQTTSQQQPHGLPFWANGDKILHEIRVAGLLSVVNLANSSSRSSASSVFTEDMSKGVRTTHASPMIYPVNEKRPPPDLSNQGADMEKQASPEPPQAQSGKVVRALSGPRHRLRLDLASPWQTRSKRASGTKLGGNPRVQKRTFPPSMQRRSSKNIRLYELDLKGNAVECRAF